MKHLILALSCCVLLAGCPGTMPVKQEVVTVNKPVPFIPTPPDVPKCVSMVDQLTPADQKDPGKVGQAYKYDTLCFRQRDKIVQMILDQYKAGSQNFDAINKEIDVLVNKIKDQAATAP